MRDVVDPALATVTRLPQTGMLTLRARLQAEGLAEALDRCGLALPEPRRLVSSFAGGVGWMSPDELLILCAPEAAGDLRAQLSGALSGNHALVAEVSDARARFAIEGPGARIALAKLCPADLSDGVFGPGEIRRSRLAQIACAIWSTGDDAFELVCFRSVADYAEMALRNAAAHLQDMRLP
jgi:sarcosine oxidase subunit gamma